MGNDQHPGISLASEAKSLGVQVEDATKFDSMDLRRSLAKRLVLLFLLLNLLTVGFVGLITAVEMCVLLRTPLEPGSLETYAMVAQHRLITSEVVMAILGATVVQVGSAVWIMTKYFFPPKDAQASPLDE